MNRLAISQSIDALGAGKVIAYPTESVYGLGCDINNAHAIQALLLLKKRHADKGLIVVASHWADVAHLIADLPKDIALPAMWPDTTTYLFPAHQNTSRLLTGQHPDIAIRLSQHPVIKALTEGFGPIVSSSANITGEAILTTPAQINSVFGHGLAGITEGPLGHAKQPSQIIHYISGKTIRD